MQLGEYARLSLDTHLGFWLQYPDTSIVVLVYGGGPALTVGTRDAFFNLSLLVYGGTVFTKESSGWENFTGVLLLPNLGGSIRLSERVKLSLEVHAPALVAEDGTEAWQYGEVWAFAYGVRFFGEEFYGDVAFVIPVFPGVTTLLQYCPIGFPMVSFGFLL